ncbi:unnamed protein product [Heterobilharzia americana]|nr:unnamed protein product [Heterobilharzia americana]
MEHKRLIQRVNTHLWAYATTRNVLTLADMEQLIQMASPNEYQLLGPIIRLPAALEILQTSEFNPRVITCFTLGSTNQVLKMCTEDILNELKECICKNRYRLPTTVSRGSVYTWWESVFTQHMLAILDNVRVANLNSQSDTLDQLAKYGIRIKGFTHIAQEIINGLRPENLNKASRLAQEQLDNDIRQIYEKFASSLLSDRAMKLHRSRKPIIVLKQLANCATKLHIELQNWADEKNLVWPEGHLDSLLVFGQFMQRIAATGPFRTLVHLLILIFNTESMDINKLLTRVLSSTQKANSVLASSSTPPAATSSSSLDFIDLTMNSDNEEDKLCETAPDIDEIVDRFNQLLSQQTENNEQKQSENLWLSLASLERELLTQLDQKCKTSRININSSRSLLSYLSEAINKDANSVTPFPVNLTNIQQDKTGTNSSDFTGSQNTNVSEADQKSLSNDVDPAVVFDFVQKLTCISLRSKEELCKLVCDNLNIQYSPKLDQFIGSILSQLADDCEEENKLKPLVYHHNVRLPSILTTEEIQQSMSSRSSTIISRLLTQRDYLLKFLSTCPSLTDLEVWSQWYQDGLFYDRWGSLDLFLMQHENADMCSRFNLMAIRILPYGGPILRLTAHPSVNDLKNALEKWQCSRNTHTIRLIGDYLIGAVIKTTSLSSEQACSSLHRLFTTHDTSSSGNVFFSVRKEKGDIVYWWTNLSFIL